MGQKTLKSFFQYSAKFCQRCALAFTYIEKRQQDMHISLPLVCMHQGPDALFISLLFRKYELFVRLNSQHPHRFTNKLVSHFHPQFFWPFPYFRNFCELEAYESWGFKNWYNENSRRRVTDSEVLQLSLPSINKQSSSAYSLSWISAKRGFGLFAGRDIFFNTCIGLYTGLIRPYSVLEKCNHSYTALLPSTDLFSVFKKKWVIDSIVAGSELRFVNHSNVPNLGSSIVLWRSLPLLSFYALRDIKKNEELTINYGRLFWMGK